MTEQKTRTRALLIITTIIWAILVLPALFIALMSAMLFDAPGSEENPLIWFIFFSFLSFTPMCIVAFLAWIPYKRENYIVARIMAFAPLVSVFFSLVAVVLLGAIG